MACLILYDCQHRLRLRPRHHYVDDPDQGLDGLNIEFMARVVAFVTAAELAKSLEKGSHTPGQYFVSSRAAQDAGRKAGMAVATATAIAAGVPRGQKLRYRIPSEKVAGSSQSV